MKRITGTILPLGAMLLAGSISGCVNVEETGGSRPHWGRSFGPPAVPGVEGPYGTPIPMASPYNVAPPTSQWAAMQMMRNDVPAWAVQQNPAGSPLSNPMGGAMPPTAVPPGGTLSPRGVPFAPGAPGGPMSSPYGPGGPPMGPGGLPMGPGGPMGPMGPSLGMGMPGMGGIAQAGGFQNPQGNSGVMRADYAPNGGVPGDVVQAQFGGSSPIGALFPAQRTQVFFSSPVGMRVHWYTQAKDGTPSFSDFPLETPGRYNFAQGAIYRLKLTRIGKERPGLELYPTLEVVPTGPKTNEFLAHNSVPLEFTEEDFRQVVDRNYIVKVVYLPDPQFQDVAGAGPGEIVSTRLEPGQDPIQEALRRGSILLVVRLGNIDQNVPASPALTSPIPGGGNSPMMSPGLGVPPNMGVAPFFQYPYMGPQPIRPPMMPISPNNLPQMPPGVLPPQVSEPGPEGERKKVPALPLLPTEQRNNGQVLIPFGPPVPPLEDPKVGVQMPPNVEVPGMNKIDPKKIDPLPAFTLPPLQMPMDEPKLPGQVAPALTPEKVEIAPPGIQVNPPKLDKEPAFPPLPANPTLPNKDPGVENSIIPGLPVPPLPAKMDGTKSGAVPSPLGLPPLPTSPPINPESISGPDLPGISVPPLPEKK